jgi:hypothetical protein
MSKRWVKGPAFEVMKQLSPKRSFDPHIYLQAGSVFLPGDELLLDFSGEERRRRRARHYGVKRPPYIGIVYVEAISGEKALRVRLKNSAAKKSGVPYEQWGFWRHAVGWRRP